MDQVLCSVRNHIFQITLSFLHNSHLCQMRSSVGCCSWMGNMVVSIAWAFLPYLQGMFLFPFSFWTQQGLKWKIRRGAVQWLCRHAFDQVRTGCSAWAARWLDPGQLSTTASSEGQHRRVQALLPGQLGAQVERCQPGAPGCVIVPWVFSCHAGLFSSQPFAPGILSDVLRTCS